jgi:2-polyprenyl-6-methoxyphenol hydroxylase-like FAD-dependent oxidoreductase
MSTEQETRPYDTDVIIAGAGPVGLALALELGVRGVDCVVVERRDGSVPVPRMSGVSTRNMEYCRRWGISGEVKAAAWVSTHPMDFVYVTELSGDEIGRLEIPSYAARGVLPHTPEGPCPCPQNFFDPVLAKRAKSLDCVTLRYQTQLERFDQAEQGVDVEITDRRTGARETLRGAYLVGCDGPAGAVRPGLDIELDGQGVVAHSVNIYFRCPDLVSRHDKGWAKFYRLVDETGCWGELIAIDGVELWRLTVFHELSSDMDDKAYLSKMMGHDFPYEIIDTSPWERRDYVARSYGRGRVYIAGDAAHQNSPTGGLGMHTGIIEAGNIAWKLDAMLKGWGGDGLLGTYETECRPVARRNVELSTAAFRHITSIPPADEARRTLVRNDPKLDSLTISEQTRTQYFYEDSPIIVPDGTVPPPDDGRRFVPSARPGTRAPHAWIDDSTSTLVLFGDGFVLLRLGEAPPDVGAIDRAASGLGMPLRMVEIKDPDVAALYERRLVLVRPDGHVAWRDDTPPAHPDAILRKVTGHIA